MEPHLKLFLFLDLDYTILHTSQFPIYSPGQGAASTQLSESIEQFYYFEKQEKKYYPVRLRPFLLEFLDTLKDFY